MAQKTAIVTGSTKGIGKGYAKAFLNRGVNVVISGRSQDTVDAAVKELDGLGKDGARAAGVVCEVSDAVEVQVLWDFAKQEFETVDIWINNAGFARSGVSLLQLTPDEIETMVHGNVIGTINGCQVAIREMTAQGFGHIYNTYGAGSDGRVIPGMIGYGTTKSAVRYFTESLIKELKGRHIKVGMISPGMNLTENMINQMKKVPPPARPKVMKPINMLGDYVETTTPWIVDRVLANDKMGTHIKWLTTGKILRRLLLAPFTKRDLWARFDLND
jgi:NADP-dependent 3-hydroxy acid dehydrogenase YdfG